MISAMACANSHLWGSDVSVNVGDNVLSSLQRKSLHLNRAAASNRQQRLQPWLRNMTPEHHY
jgi:hypothetical protein